MRVPFIARWPGQIPAGRGRTPAGDDDRPAADDRQARRRAAADDRIDGRDIWPLLVQPARCADRRTRRSTSTGATSCRPCAAATGSCTCRIRIGRSTTSGRDGTPGKFVRKELPLSLFDLDKDPGESTNVAEQHPDVVKKLMEYVERAREDLGDSLTGRVGKNVRPAGKL